MDEGKGGDGRRVTTGYGEFVESVFEKRIAQRRRIHLEVGTAER